MSKKIYPRLSSPFFSRTPNFFEQYFKSCPATDHSPSQKSFNSTILWTSSYLNWGMAVCPTMDFRNGDTSESRVDVLAEWDVYRPPVLIISKVTIWIAGAFNLSVSPVQNHFSFLKKNKYTHNKLRVLLKILAIASMVRISFKVTILIWEWGFRYGRYVTLMLLLNWFLP